ncbi:hypothetical protein B296_00000371 [Ensete ventricosum]|uniref:Membrane magnesium transporter n=1 Tax=Ensete ventricosum TaxID=4639 RepID=A0A427BBX3_ENSVE|nr:hypothetical protein B296_00000371 [Ensete ventricosum]
MRVGFMVGILGGILLAHAGYATIQCKVLPIFLSFVAMIGSKYDLVHTRYRGVLKIVEEEFSRPPMNVVVELLLGLAFCIWAALAAPAKFRSIHPDSEENRYLCICMI